jgi:hypothetical protein
MSTRTYSADEIDAFAAYCEDVDRCDRRNVQLRLAPTKNNQAQGINWASDYEFAAKLGGLGAVAQLGERRRGTPKATGSSPVGSTEQIPLLG